MGALAEFERSFISERTRAGIAAAKARCKSSGRLAKLSANQVDAVSKELQLHDRRIKDVAEGFAVSKSTVRRALGRSQKQRGGDRGVELAVSCPALEQGLVSHLEPDVGRCRVRNANHCTADDRVRVESGRRALLAEGSL
jgi:hypothetical protein